MRSVSNRLPKSRGRTQVTFGQTNIGEPGKGLCVCGNRDQRAVGDARISARRRLDAVSSPSVERQHQCPHHAVVIERVDAVRKDPAVAPTTDVMLSASDEVDARLRHRLKVAQTSGIRGATLGSNSAVGGRSTPTYLLSVSEQIEESLACTPARARSVHGLIRSSWFGCPDAITGCMNTCDDQHTAVSGTFAASLRRANDCCGAS